MGGGVSTPERHRVICDRLKKQKEKGTKHIKILLLGSGESGKSTILKQMKIIHAGNKGAFSKEEKEKYLQLVFNNTICSIQCLINACRGLKIPMTTVGSDKIADRLLALDPESDERPHDAKDDLLMMWEDDGIKQAFNRQGDFHSVGAHLLDSAEYFLNNVNRTFADDFQLTQQDILRTRMTTTGIIETMFEHMGIGFTLYDVGGQRGERKRWIHSFDDVTAIMFIASLSEYDQKLAEDSSMNRLEESLNLFESVANLPWFSKAAIFLFLNKKDIFAKKICTTPISDYHPQMVDWLYKDGVTVAEPWVKGEDKKNYEEGVKFVRDLYSMRIDDDEDGTEKLYIFETDATHTDNITNVWKATKHTALRGKLLDSSMQMI